MLRVAHLLGSLAAAMVTDCEHDAAELEPRKVLFTEEAKAYKGDAPTCCRPSLPYVTHNIEVARHPDRFGHEVVHQAPAEHSTCSGEPAASTAGKTFEQCTTLAETTGVRFVAYSQSGACRVFAECATVEPERKTTVFAQGSGRHDLYWKAIVNAVTGNYDERCGRCTDKPYLFFNKQENRYCCSPDKPQDERWFDALHLIEFVLLPGTASWAPEYEKKMRPRIEMLYEISKALRRALTLPSEDGDDLPADAGSKSPPFILNALGLNTPAEQPAEPKRSGFSGIWGAVKQAPWQLGNWLDSTLGEGWGERAEAGARGAD